MVELRNVSEGDVTGNILYPGLDYSLPAGFGTGTAAAVNAAIAACSAAGGGIVYLPATDIALDATIDNKYSRVLVLGAGQRAMFHDGGSPTYGTRLLPSFAGTVLKHRTPFAAELGAAPARNDGGGFENITVEGNSIATRLLEVTSVCYGSYDLFLRECVGAEAALFTCGVSNTDIAEAADVQAMLKCNITFRQLAAGAALACDGVVFSGSSNANVSANNYVTLNGQYKNGVAFRGTHCDNNLISVRAFRASGGTGYTIYAHGATASLGGCYSNMFTYVSGGGTVYAEGTDTGGVTAGKNNTILYLDVSNSTPVPTNGTGATWRYQTSAFTRSGGGELGLIAANSLSALTPALAELGTQSLLIRNSSQNHTLWTDGTNKWSLNIDGSGNFRWLRTAGTGYIELSNLARQGALLLQDGVSTQTGPTGYAAIYIDTADGDLKIKFADGTIKTIVVDT